MRIFRLNKLVRDGVYKSMLKLGQQPQHRILDDDEFAGHMSAKLREEANEYDSTTDGVEELGDLIQAIEDEAIRRGASLEEVLAAHQAKK